MSQDIMNTTRHKCTHTHLQCLHARTHAHASTRTSTHIHTHTHMHTRTHMHTACAHAHALHANTHVHTRTHACTCGRAHAYTHTCTQARTHTHTHKHACTHSSVLSNNLARGTCCFTGCVYIRQMCVWHRTTGIALYLGLKSRQSSTEPNFRLH